MSIFAYFRIKFTLTFGTFTFFLYRRGRREPEIGRALGGRRRPGERRRRLLPLRADALPHAGTYGRPDGAAVARAERPADGRADVPADGHVAALRRTRRRANSRAHLTTHVAPNSSTIDPAHIFTVPLRRNARTDAGALGPTVAGAHAGPGARPQIGRASGRERG